MCHSFTRPKKVRKVEMTGRWKNRWMFLRAPSGISRQGGIRNICLLFLSDDFLLVSRSNKNSPKQEIGTAPNTSERHEEKMHLSNDKEEETIPVYRASIKDKVVDVIGEEKVWATMGEMAPGCPLAHNRAVKIEEGFVNREAIDKILVEEETKIEESEKPSGCPYSHKDL